MTQSIAQGIASRLLIATLTTGAWRATRQNRKEAREVESRNAAKTGVAKVSVRQSDHEALREIYSLHQEAYSIHRSLTLPSVQDGMRMLPAGRELEHAAKMTELKGRIDAAIDRLAADYWSEMQRQRLNLGNVFDARAWPGSTSELRSLFTFHSRYLKVPDGEPAWQGWLAESATVAADEMQSRVEAALVRVAERCGSGGKLYATVFDDLRLACGLAIDALPSDSPTVQVATSALAGLGHLRADSIRDDSSTRSKVADHARSLASTFGSLSI